MTTQLFAPTTNAAASSEITVTASAPVTVAIKASGYIGMDSLEIQRKDSGGTWRGFKRLYNSRLGETLTGAGTYRVVKGATTNAIGADQD